MPNLAVFRTTSTAPAVTFMTTTLATLASSTLSVASSITQVQSSQLRIYCDAELVVGTTVGPFGAGASFAMYLSPIMDGTNAVEADTAQLQNWTVFPATTSTVNAQHRIYRSNLICPISDFTVLINNGTTQSLTTGSGANTLKLAFYDVNLNG